LRAALFALALAACSGSSRYDLYVHIQVKPKHWIREEPDLVVALNENGQQLDTCRILHESSGDCHLNAVLADVNDFELVLVDRKGRAHLDTAAKLNTLIEMKTEGEIKAAEIRIQPGYPWLALRLIGCAGGIALALGAMRRFRTQIFPPEPEPPKCSHCGKRIADNALRCDHCGAAQ